MQLDTDKLQEAIDRIDQALTRLTEAQTLISLVQITQAEAKKNALAHASNIRISQALNQLDAARELLPEPRKEGWTWTEPRPQPAP
ncbi:MAG: hypothetical protein ACLQVL_19850 [Terriglobia bacterium]